MKSALLLALIDLCTVWMGPRGPVLHRQTRALGGERYLRWVEATMDSAAELTGVPVFLLAKLAHSESGLNPRAVSTKGATGLLQLMPQTPHWREWRRVCQLSPEDCNHANLLIGARELIRAWRVCGGGWELAVGRYRGIGCRARRKDVALVDAAVALRERSERRWRAQQRGQRAGS